MCLHARRKGLVIAPLVLAVGDGAAGHATANATSHCTHCGPCRRTASGSANGCPHRSPAQGPEERPNPGTLRCISRRIEVGLLLRPLLTLPAVAGLLLSRLPSVRVGIDRRLWGSACGTARQRGTETK